MVGTCGHWIGSYLAGAPAEGQSPAALDFRLQRDDYLRLRLLRGKTGRRPFHRRRRFSKACPLNSGGSGQSGRKADFDARGGDRKPSVL